jgi:hypothetical protein
MQALLLIGLWALLLQWGMLFFVRLQYRAWSWRKQHLVAGLILPVMVAAMALWLWFGQASCGPDAKRCVAGAIALGVALRLVGMLLVAGGLLVFVDRMRGRS